MRTDKIILKKYSSIGQGKCSDSYLKKGKRKKHTEMPSTLPCHKAFAAQPLQQVTIYLVEYSELAQVLYMLAPRR